MPTRNVVLTEHQASLVERVVTSGRYQNASEVLREIMGAKARDDIGSGIRTLHVARQGRKGRHSVVFKEAEGRIIDVLRLLHDSMDLPRHVPVANNQAQ